jgi:predicted nucleic acid-binding protein
VIVVDASVLANVVGDDGSAGRIARDRITAASGWSAPDLVDVETVSVLRRRWRAGDLTARRFRSAVDDLLSMPIVRFPTGPLMIRAYELRSNVTPYDAAYIALAEGLSCPLVSADARLAGAPGLHCAVELLAQARSL